MTLLGDSLYVVAQDSCPACERDRATTVKSSTLVRCWLGDDKCQVSPINFDQGQDAGFVAVDIDRESLVIVGHKAEGGGECCTPTRVAFCDVDGARCTSRDYSTNDGDVPVVFDATGGQLLHAFGDTTSLTLRAGLVEAYATRQPEREAMKAFVYPLLVANGTPAFSFDEARRRLVLFASLNVAPPGAPPMIHGSALVSCEVDARQCDANAIPLLAYSDDERSEVEGVVAIGERIAAINVRFRWRQNAASAEWLTCGRAGDECRVHALEFDAPIPLKPSPEAPSCVLRALGGDEIAVAFGGLVGVCSATKDAPCKLHAIAP
jgi:hypothetical protein